MCDCDFCLDMELIDSDLEDLFFPRWKKKAHWGKSENHYWRGNYRTDLHKSRRKGR